MNYIKIILSKDIGNIIGKYLFPCKKLIESNRKYDLYLLRIDIEWIKTYLDM